MVHHDDWHKMVPIMAAIQHISIQIKHDYYPPPRWHVFLYLPGLFYCSRTVWSAHHIMVHCGDWYKMVPIEAAIPQSRQYLTFPVNPRKNEDKEKLSKYLSCKCLCLLICLFGRPDLPPPPPPRCLVRIPAMEPAILRNQKVKYEIACFAHLWWRQRGMGIQYFEWSGGCGCSWYHHNFFCIRYEKQIATKWRSCNHAMIFI